MGKIGDFIGKWLPRNEKEKIPCALCGKAIDVPAFVFVRGTIVIDDKTLKNPTIFQCLEHAFNYAQGYYAHPQCWMDRLKQLGVPLYDMEEVRAEINKKARLHATKRK